MCIYKYIYNLLEVAHAAGVHTAMGSLLSPPNRWGFAFLPHVGTAVGRTRHEQQSDLSSSPMARVEYGEAVMLAAPRATSQIIKLPDSAAWPRRGREREQLLLILLRGEGGDAESTPHSLHIFFIIIGRNARVVTDINAVHAGRKSSFHQTQCSARGQCHLQPSGGCV